MRQKIPS